MFRTACVLNDIINCNNTIHEGLTCHCVFIIFFLFVPTNKNLVLPFVRQWSLVCQATLFSTTSFYFYLTMLPTLEKITLHWKIIRIKTKLLSLIKIVWVFHGNDKIRMEYRLRPFMCDRMH